MANRSGGRGRPSRTVRSSGTPAFTEPEVRRWPHPIEGAAPSARQTAPAGQTDTALYYIHCALRQIECRGGRSPDGPATPSRPVPAGRRGDGGPRAKILSQNGPPDTLRRDFPLVFWRRRPYNGMRYYVTLRRAARYVQNPQTQKKTES